MPGRNDPHTVNSRFTPDWLAYRKGITEDDDVSTDLLIAALPVINLATPRHVDGTNNFLLLYLRDDFTAASVTIDLYIENDGDLVSAVRFSLDLSLPGSIHDKLVAITDLRAGEYRIALSSVTGGASWDIYYTEGTGDLPEEAIHYMSVSGGAPS